MKDKTACFTGHRELREAPKMIASRLSVILEELIRQGYRYFGAGGARGFDMLAAKTVLKLKKQYPHIHLILVLPFPNQYEAEKNWSIAEILEYHYLKKVASKVVHLEESYSRGCYYRRNEHLVNCSSVCISYRYKDRGGTAYTTRYAETRGLRVINCI